MFEEVVMLKLGERMSLRDMVPPNIWWLAAALLPTRLALERRPLPCKLFGGYLNTDLPTIYCCPVRIEVLF
jgi:hypothetical protein